MMMKAAIYIGKKGVESDDRIASLFSELEAGGCTLHFLVEGERPSPDSDILLSVGGDGTFLSSSTLVAGSDIPVLGVNAGRLGFLSENRPENIAKALLGGDFRIESRAMLKADVVTGSPSIDSWPYALNEITVHRSGAAMLGVDVSIDGIQLPTYWADGLVISTSSGSTAYSLSAGGAILTPEVPVFMVTPVCAFSMRTRPTVYSDNEIFTLTIERGKGILLADGFTIARLSEGTSIRIKKAPFTADFPTKDGSGFFQKVKNKLND